METCWDPPAWMEQGPGVNLVFPDHCLIGRLRSFVWSDFYFFFTIPLKFLHNAKSFFLEVAERVNASPFQVYNKEESPRDSADDHKPQSPQHVFLTWCQSDISRMMTWLQRSAGDLLCVAANSAAFEKTLDITESLKLTFKHDSGFSHQLISAIIIVH